jgi:hypothetical protein
MRACIPVSRKVRQLAEREQTPEEISDRTQAGQIHLGKRRQAMFRKQTDFLMYESPSVCIGRPSEEQLLARRSAITPNEIRSKRET